MTHSSRLAAIFFGAVFSGYSDPDQPAKTHGADSEVGGFPDATMSGESGGNPTALGDEASSDGHQHGNRDGHVGFG